MTKSEMVLVALLYLELLWLWWLKRTEEKP